MKEKLQIEKKIKQIELQLKRLTLNASSSEVYDDLQNSLILKKAILKKDLEILKKNPIVEGVKSTVKKLLPKREKLICDYFN